MKTRPEFEAMREALKAIATEHNCTLIMSAPKDGAIKLTATMESCLSPDEEKKLFRKHKITARKYNGDDCYSWAVFRNGSVQFDGISQNSVLYYKRLVLKDLLS